MEQLGKDIQIIIYNENNNTSYYFIKDLEEEKSNIVSRMVHDSIDGDKYEFEGEDIFEDVDLSSTPFVRTTSRFIDYKITK